MKVTRHGVLGAVAFSTAISVSSAYADVALGSLLFELQGFDLDSGSVMETTDSDGELPIDITIAYNATRSNSSVVIPTSMTGTEIAYSLGVGFDGVSVESIDNLSFSTQPVDVPFSSDDTVVIRTAMGLYYKIGNIVESEDGVTFNYCSLQ
jgi:hypothetical protein